MWLKLLILALALYLPSATVYAQFPTLSENYRYSAANRQLIDVLRGFAADQRLNVVFDPAIEDLAISESVELPPTEFLNYITGKYGLLWYYDGTSLYIYRGSNLATRAFRLRYTNPDRVIATLKKLNAYSERFPFRILEEERVILAVAPPRMLEMTAFVVTTLEAGGLTEATSGLSIAVFPLKYASAADQNLEFEGSTSIVPGVATILQSLVSGQAVSGRVSTYLPRNLAGLTGYGLNRFSHDSQPRLPGRSNLPNDLPEEVARVLPEAAPQGEADEVPPPVNPSGVPVIQPTISADTRTNSVVVRDTPDRMPAYEQLVRALDQPTGLIEITAKIIDVSKEGVFEWGMPHDILLNQTETSRQLTTQLTPTDTANLAVTLLEGQATQFMLRIKALEQDGYARVASRPSLITMDNVEAQIDNSETFFVRVEGDFEVELFDVSIGTTLNILPRIIEQEGQRMIKLNVQVSDGSVLEQTVDEIPRIRSDSITTQAMLREHQCLLIGGLFREEKSATESRVPVLGRLPGVGFLFRSKEYNTSRLERLILIEPRIVASPILVNGNLQFQHTNTPTYLLHEETLGPHRFPNLQELPPAEELPRPVEEVPVPMEEMPAPVEVNKESAIIKPQRRRPASRTATSPRVASETSSGTKAKKRNRPHGRHERDEKQQPQRTTFEFVKATAFEEVSELIRLPQP